jgi:pimeloyl-ACP methyl ester carboxylesterase
VPSATLPVSNPDRPSTEEILVRLGGEPCPDDSAFTCVTLTVPIDHFDPANTGTLAVVFAVLPASGDRRGMFVTATGGPGTAGIAYADSYTAAFDPRLTEQFDIVFFDQRGVGLSGGLTCPAAAAAFYQTDSRAETPQQEIALVNAARTFSRGCVTEMGTPVSLRYLGTNQAVEDLDAFREVMQDNRLWLYGESYGTQYAQTYAAAHPDRLGGLVLDGTVDLTLTQLAYYREQAQAFNDVLVATLQACAGQAECADDLRLDPVVAYDALAAQLERTNLPFRFSLPDGGRAVRRFTLGDLETVAAGQIYGESGRMLFNRGLAYALNRGDMSYLGRLLYLNLGLDPETLEAIPDPSYSDAIFFAVECQDYGDLSGTPDQRAQQYLRAGDAVEAAIPRLASLFYGDLPCAFWPDAAQGLARPQPLVLPGLPVLVLSADTDPATPYSNAVSVAERLADGYLITQTGGPHVLFGRGVACVDEPVTEYLLSGAVPAQRATTCQGEVTTDYVPLPPDSARDFRDPLAALASFETEVFFWPEYFYWDGVSDSAAGCGLRGNVEWRINANGIVLFSFTNCSFTRGFVASGEARYNPERDRFTFEARTNGLERCTLNYTREGERYSVNGNCGGRKVRIERTAPAP